jgi:hypothetical protein
MLFFIFSVILCASCINSEEYKKVKEEFRDVEYSGNIDNFDSIYSQIPDYSQISATINKLHSCFSQEGLLNPADADKYFNSKETAVALGMYIADLGYVRHFERVQLCTDYLEAVRTLAGKLAIGEKEFNETVPLIESNLGDKEVLFGVVDSLLNAGNVLLAANEKYGISALFLGGFWLETTYIGLSAQDETDSEFVQQILQSHFEILTQINKLFACLEDDSELKEFKTALLGLEKKGAGNEKLTEDVVNIRKKFIK